MFSKMINAIEKRTSGRIAQELRFTKDALQIVHSCISAKPSLKLDCVRWLESFLMYQQSLLRLRRYLPMQSIIGLIKRLKGLDKNPIITVVKNELLENPYYRKDDKLYIRSIILPVPAGDKDTGCFNYSIRDNLLPYMLEEFLPADLIQSVKLGKEEPSEYGVVSIEDGDVVIDARAGIGEFAALSVVRGCRAVYAFEPDPYLRETYLSKTAKYNERITVCEYALSDTTGELAMDILGIGSATAYMSKDGVKSAILAKSITLDDFAKENKLDSIDFIKADIEGAERHLLKGARYVLKEFAPKLVICTYHLPDDPAVIRELILDANQEYIIEQKDMKIYAYVPKC